MPGFGAGFDVGGSTPCQVQFGLQRQETSLGFERGAILALLRHPVLLLEAVRTRLALRRIGGLGIAQSYLAWRGFTAYGDQATTMSAHDLLYYLSWRREMRTIRKWVRVS
jgi:hypothetical protein